MSEDSGRHLRRRADALRWWWDDLADAPWLRQTWMFVGGAALLVCAVAGLVRHWSREVTLADYAVLQAACLLCQVVALFPVVSPGRAVTAKENAGVYESITLSLVCGTWIFGVLPGGAVLLSTSGPDSHQAAAVFYAGTALMLAGVAGLCGAVFLSSWAEERRREALRTRRSGDGEAPPDGADRAGHDGVDLPDAGDGGD
jgi:hypothetical protein